MAQRLLDSLPKVPKDELPSGAECMICKEEYGTVPSDNGTIEHAVWLPCDHHVGSECIAIWLSPGDGLGNSCPLCRTVFFENYLRDYDDDEDEDGDGYGDSDDDDEEEEDEDGDDEEDEDGSEGNDDEDEGEEGDDPEDRRRQTPMTPVADSQTLASSPVTTRSPQQQQTESQHAEAPSRRRPLSPTNRKIEDNQKRIPSQLLPSPPPPSSSAFQPQKSPPAQTQSPPPPMIADLKTKLHHLASAPRTLPSNPASSSMIHILIGTPTPPSGAVKGCPCVWSVGATAGDAAAVGARPTRGAFADARGRAGGFYRMDEIGSAWGRKRPILTYEAQSAVGERGERGLGLRTGLGFGSSEEGKV